MTPEEIADVLSGLSALRDVGPHNHSITGTKIGDVTISGPLIKGKTVTIEMSKGDEVVPITVTNYELVEAHQITELIENQLEAWS